MKLKDLNGDQRLEIKQRILTDRMEEPTAALGSSPTSFCENEKTDLNFFYRNKKG